MKPHISGPHPAQVILEFKRPITSEVYELTLDLEPNSSPTKYVGTWSDVTTMKGRWEIKVKNGNSNTVIFKIDKRQQIVDLASSWVGAQPDEVEAGANCNNLTAVIYNHLGLPLSGFTDPQYAQASFPCSGDGCLLFYSVNTPAGWNAGHVAIEAGGQRVNLNSITSGLPAPVSQEAKDAGVQEGIQGHYRAEIRSGSTVELDED